MTIWRQYHRRIFTRQRFFIRTQRAVKFEELHIFAIGLRKNLVPLSICLTFGDACITAGFGQHFFICAIRQGGHAKRCFTTAGTFIRGFTCTFRNHPLKRRIKVLLWQIGLTQTYINNVQPQSLRTSIRPLTDLIHQGRAFWGKDRIRRHALRPENRTNLTIQDTVELNFSLAASVHTQSFAELTHIGDTIKYKGINLQPSVIGRCNFDHRRFQRQDTVVITHDLVQKRDLEANAGFFTHLLDLAKTKHQSFFTFINDIDRRQSGDDSDDHDGNDDIEFTHQFDPRLVFRSSLSGRYGTTPCALPSLPFSRIILSTSPKTFSIVSI